jgi:hypothetical protein
VRFAADRQDDFSSRGKLWSSGERQPGDGLGLRKPAGFEHAAREVLHGAAVAPYKMDEALPSHSEPSAWNGLRPDDGNYTSGGRHARETCWIHTRWQLGEVENDQLARLRALRYPVDPLDDDPTVAGS